MEVLFEDADIIVLAKPAGTYVHPSPGHETGALTDELLHRYPEIAEVGSRERPGVVHRLDADTSGVMVFARNRRAYFGLREAFESHAEVKKTYLAVVHGSPQPRQGTLRTTIGRKPWDAKRMAVDAPDGKLAVTHWQVLQKRGGLSLVEFVIETGRTHQIRVHAAHLGSPIVGDPLYGDRQRDARLGVRARRTLLHAVQLAFPHPATGALVSFAAEPPPDIVYPV